MSPVRLSLGELADEIGRASVVYLPGASGEIRALQPVLAARPERLAGVRLVSCLVPGMNSFDYAALHAEARLTTFMLPPTLRPSFEAGRIDVPPLTYSQIAHHLRARPPELAILHLTPAQDGFCAFGVCADFGPIAATGARRRIGVLNPRMPRPRRTPTIGLDQLDAIVEVEEDLSRADAATPDETLLRVGANVAALIPDGAVLQTGIGAAPEAVWRALGQRRDLRLRSGMVSDGWLAAWRAGALARHGHLAGVAHGGAALLAELDGSHVVEFAAADRTHGGAELAHPGSFFAINSALEVDLLGQANLEWRNGRLVSGPGGAPDFMRAALRSPGGGAILALPATANGGRISRIRASLTAPGPTLSRTDTDIVVTEYGVANLRGMGLDQKAESLIAVAAPHHRAELQEIWKELRTRL